MKTNSRQLLVLSAVLSLAAKLCAGEATEPGRYWFAARAGFNVSAKFKNIGDGLFTGGNIAPRFTPGGDPYNYDDGYLLTDSSGNYGGQTWYVGYDNSASQVAGNSILLSRSTANANVGGRSEDADVSVGIEAGWHAQMGHNEKRRWGMEVSGSFQPLKISDSGSYSASVTKVTHAYNFTPGTTPPAATTGSPYQGAYGEFGFLVNDAIAGTTTEVLPGGTTITGKHELDGEMWGLRMGFYVEQTLNERWSAWVAGGLSTALVHLDGTWRESAALTGGGTATLSGSDDDWHPLFGAYASANVAYRFNESWSVVGSVEYQYLNTYRHNFDGRGAEVDFSGSVFVAIGISKSF